MSADDVLLQQAFADYQRGQFSQAEIACRQLLAANDQNGKAWQLLALLAERAGQLDDALEHAERAVFLAAYDPSVWNTLATLYEGQGELAKAERSLREALARHPHYAVGYNNLGEILKRGGRPQEATGYYRRAVEIEPAFAAARSNLLMSLLYDPSLSGEQVFAEHRHHGRSWEQGNVPAASHPNDANPDRRIRVGYLSPDFCEHSVMRFFEPILANHDRKTFEIYLYSECPIVDPVGQRLREFGDTWRITWQRSATEVASQITADRIDVLVDLAGHTRHNRLDVMALRPAPVQCTYLGYPSITGLSAIDYRLTDAVLDPPVESADQAAEQLVRLPGGYAIFHPPVTAPPVAQRHRTPSEPIRFVSHHPAIKLNRPLLRCWKQLLDRVPNARLTFIRSEFRGEVAAWLEAEIVACGLPEGRVEIRAVSTSPVEYLSSYAEFDAVLDAFPFNGHTMTCEALWMGVPVITCLGDRPAGRLSASVLTILGLTDLIASSPEEYIRIAVDLANNPARLVELRQRLRPLMVDRMGGPAWVHSFEEVLREIWQHWCKNRGPIVGVSPREPGATPQLDTKQQAARLAELGEQYEAAGDYTGSEQHYEAAAQLEPWDGNHALRLGNLFTLLHRYPEAERQYRQAVAVDPGCFPAWAMLGQTHANDGRVEAARSTYERALQVRRDPKLRIVLATLLPQVYASTGQMKDCLARVVTALGELQSDGVSIDPTSEVIPNFFLLAYQGGNLREVQRKFATLFRPPSSVRERRRPAPASDGRIRVGLLSEYFCNHTIGSLNIGLAERLDRSRFELTVISAAKSQDALAQRYRQAADRFVLLPGSIPAALSAVRELDLDILLYADLGMSCIALTLACSRLAPVQCVTWGHPLTTGLDTIDFFLSGKLFEAPGAEEHYSERLIRLPGLQTCYERPPLESGAWSRARLNAPPGGHLYGCPQSLFKFHPEFDDVLAGILRTDRAGHLILIEGKRPGWTSALEERWQLSMPDVLERVHFISGLSRPEFVAFCAQMDVLLDPINFGGGNTTLEGLAVGTPVVTWPTPFLRSRLATGMYSHMGWTECVASSAQEYIEIALRLAGERDANEHARRTIQQASGSLFDHLPSVQAFEEFFVQAFESEPHR